ncbi:hypothetical protein DICVIV_05282 [Dictyocaulus viviparus]|uniref:Regulator of condensation n=1 Tax=Dictyocaulus viviparus TaxID=29172 RepID=A0A0D8XVQ1_DICVI|nr:hypothetical protein DICVIV_05282 [Dictyocaulus viviparus]
MGIMHTILLSEKQLILITKIKGQAVLKKAVNQLAEFCSKSVWVQLLTFDAIHRLNIPELIVLMINACRNLKNGFTVPVRLLLHDRLPTVLDNELLLPSYAMAVGENSSFNLGVPSDGPVKEARKVKKVSMSSNHALFLTYKGEVFACGATTNFDTGESNGKLVVNPIKITFPNEVLPIVDLSAGPHHSVFITKKVIYVCGVNNKFCLGLKKDGCHYVMKHLKLPFPERARGVQLDKVYTNEECTIIFSSGVEFCEIWIAGKTPNKIHETFKIMDDTAEVNYGMIRGNVARIGINNALEVLYWSAKSSIFPVSVAQVNYQNRGLKNVKVVITNSDGILNYTFDTRPGREYIQPCVISVNGFLVDIYCVDYHTTLEGDVLLLGYLRRSKSIRFTSDFYTLYRGKLFVIEDKVLDDGFTEVYSNDSNLSGLRLLIMLQEVPGAHTVSSFTCSPDGKNLIYVTNSATIYRIKQWQTADFVDLLPFFDQYLLHSVVADAIRIIFEQVNEFSVGFIFDLYDVLPQVRLLLAEYFFNNLHLITLWKNSLTASVDLIRDVFSFAELDISQPDRISSALDVHFSLEPPSIYILGDYQKVDWSLFRTEDILDILTEHPGDTSQELEILNFLQDNGLMRDYSKKLCSLKSYEPELVTTVRERILGRNHTSASRRARKKTNQQPNVENYVPTVEECTKSNDSVLDLPASKHEHPDVKQKTTEHFGKNVLNSNVYDEQYKSTSLMNKSTEDLSKITVPPLVMSSMKRRSGRFTPKGVKFRCANNLLVEKQSGTHFAPWAAIATSPKGSGVLPMSMIFEEEMNRSRKIDNVSVSPLKEKTRPSQSTSTCGIPWNEAFIASSSALSSSRPSLIEIIKEEEQRLKKGYSHVSQPLHFIEDEERAIEELTQLYRENAGDELIVRVERCNISSKITMPNSLWTNFPRSNF